MTRHRTLVLVTVATGTLLLSGCRGGSVADAPATSAANSAVTSPANSVATSATSAARPGPDTEDIDEIEAQLDRLEREIETDGER